MYVPILPEQPIPATTNVLSGSLPVFARAFIIPFIVPKSPQPGHHVGCLSDLKSVNLISELIGSNEHLRPCRRVGDSLDLYSWASVSWSGLQSSFRVLYFRSFDVLDSEIRDFGRDFLRKGLQALS